MKKEVLKTKPSMNSDTGDWWRLWQSGKTACKRRMWAGLRRGRSRRRCGKDRLRHRYVYVFLQRNRADRIYRCRYTDVLVYSLSHIWPFCDSMDCRLPGSSVCGVSQERILDWVAISFSGGSSQPRDGTHIWFFTTESPRKPDRYIEIYKRRFYGN